MKKLNQAGFHLVPVLLLVLFLAVAGFAGYKVLNGGKDNGKKGSSSQSGGEDAFMRQYGQNCKDRKVAFTSPPMEMDQLAYIRPLGAVSDGHVTPTDHVYIGPSNPNAADNTYKVIMPADGTVTQVDRMPDQYIGDRQGTQLPSQDHRLVISFNCQYFAIFIHVHKLAGPLANVGEKLYPNQQQQTNIELKAGDTLGFIGGSTFDWIPIDTKVTLEGFSDPKSYEGEPWKIHTISPFDLYSGSLKKQLEAKSLRTAAPVGGKIDYDQTGKLIGSWFREGSGGYSGGDQNQGRYWDGHLSVAPDYIDPSYTVVSIGNWQGAAAQFTVTNKATPASVSSKSGIVKYQLTPLSYVTGDGSAYLGSGFANGVHPNPNGGAMSGTIAFQVLPGNKVRVEKFPGKTAEQVTGFTTAAQTYER